MTTLDRPDPPFRQITNRIKQGILTGQYAPGDKIPSARQIMAEYGVSISTAAKALNALSAEGLIETRGGSGSRVRRIRVGTQGYALGVLRRGRIYPDGYYAKISEPYITQASPAVADALGLEEGEPVIRRERTAYGPDNQPLSCSVSWFDASLAEVAPLLLSTERILQGTTQYVCDMTGRVRSERERAIVKASRASEGEAVALGVEPGAPVLRGRNIYWDMQDKVIEYGESCGVEDLEESFEYTVGGETQ